MKKVIIITGAGAGIGKACAEYFLKKNYNVALLGRNRNKLIIDSKKIYQLFLMVCILKLFFCKNSKPFSKLISSSI